MWLAFRPRGKLAMLPAAPGRDDAKVGEHHDDEQHYSCSRRTRYVEDEAEFALAKTSLNKLQKRHSVY